VPGQEPAQISGLLRGHPEHLVPAGSEEHRAARKAAATPWSPAYQAIVTDMGEVCCHGCGAVVPDMTGPVHEYMLAAPGCWALYAGLEDWKIAQARQPGGLAVSMHLVDCYAAQHAASPDPRNRRSVAVHLMSLCAALEHAYPGAWRRQAMGAWTHRDYPLLDPRPSAFEITVREVADAPDASRTSVANAMAQATWAAWSAHHDRIRAWFTDAADRRGRRQGRHGN
jgi:hypothetical protein